MVLHILCLLLICLIALSLFRSVLTHLLHLLSALVFHKVQFLGPCSLPSIPHPSATFSLIHGFPTTYMLTIPSSADAPDNLSVLSSTLDSVYAWFTCNRLSVNPSKTEYMLIDNSRQRAKLTSTSLTFCGNNLAPVDICSNLSVVFGKELYFEKHISSICSTSFYHIRQLRQIRSSLDTNSAIVLANALVSSKLDYCNSLLYDLPEFSLDRLQSVQNALARVVVPSVKRFHNISPTLKTLHWLPIRGPINFKIASLTLKSCSTYKRLTF